MITSTTELPTEPVTLSENLTPGARIIQNNHNSWRLEIPAGPQGTYNLAQLDDYTQHRRERFPWKPPISLELYARASDDRSPGTWGFGLWNDPFSFSMGFGGGVRRLPAFPNAIWFFFAAPQNYLSLRDDLPTSGNLASIFRSPNLPSFLFIPGVIFLPLLFLPPFARWLRRMAGRMIQQESISFATDLREWHHYRLLWQKNRVSFFLDKQKILESPLTPHAPLGLVLWIDNQFLAWLPDGHFDYGSLESASPAWVEIKKLKLEQG